MAKVEAPCGRERSGEPAAEILSEAKELQIEFEDENGEREI